MSDGLYDVVRMYFDHPERRPRIKRGLTLEEAQAHCRDPETSSSTATSSDAVARTKKYGTWFDGFEDAR